MIRLEEKYGVKITFPRESAENGEGKTREALKADEVLVKGGRKGVASAKSEILEVRIVFLSAYMMHVEEIYVSSGFFSSFTFRPSNLRKNRITLSSLLYPPNLLHVSLVVVAPT